MSWAARQRQALGAVVITVSHNPPEWLGIKIKGPFGGSVDFVFTARVERRLRVGSVVPPARGPISRFDAWTPHLEGLSQLVDCQILAQHLKDMDVRVLVDSMHGGWRQGDCAGCWGPLWRKSVMTGIRCLAAMYRQPGGPDPSDQGRQDS